MKKLSVFLILAIAAFAFVGCSDDGTSLRWDNQSNSSLKDIQWINSASVNQQWSGVVNHEDRTDYREITKLSGQGECLFEGGAPASITLSAGAGVVDASSNSATIEKDVDATLIIESAK